MEIGETVEATISLVHQFAGLVAGSRVPTAKEELSADRVEFCDLDVVSAESRSDLLFRRQQLVLSRRRRYV